ncbi:transcriptional regulator [Klebsiella michiganensis]|uniref:Transcriptional regulator n=1 Tax=Klebsiella michiganensis TaxID=1134687 RepID=A0AB35W9E9_9ENTR|nr:MULTISPECIES: transcriptional regulator [Klebsiella]AID91196.1 transcriptional regulator [Klebsiella oxytoca KONIH1]AUV95202.1 transcriptional regulator [Klebsiella oxytoca]OFU84678.1 transcriptional regulator [Proteus sp. HMSC10D02]AOV15024.1 transcriptional regulator [Klebsiella sp. LTGPAF-6F]AUW01644.1 transcriptional regulator [Klebsiella oxytoca]
MKKINIAINTRNTFLRESLVAIVNELISRSGNLKAAFSYKHNDFLDKDIIIAEVLPGEIYLCNTSIKNRKKNSSVIILHSYDKLPEKELIVNCLKGVTFVSIKAVNIDKMFEIIAHELKRSELLPLTQRIDSPLICTNCPHKMLSKSQVAVATGIIHGFDIGKISALNKVTPKTITWHKSKIMEKYSLNNNYDFFQFINLLKERW